MDILTKLHILMIAIVLKSVKELLSVLGVRGQLILWHVFILWDLFIVCGVLRLEGICGLCNGLLALNLGLAFGRSVRRVPSQLDPSVSKPSSKECASTFFREPVTELSL